MSYVMRKVGQPPAPPKNPDSPAVSSSSSTLFRRSPKTQKVDKTSKPPISYNSFQENPAVSTGPISHRDFLRSDGRFLPPTSNFLINRHRLLRKTQESGSVTGAHPSTTTVTDTLTQNNEQQPPIAISDTDVDAKTEPHDNLTSVSTLSSVRINPTADDDISEIDARVPQEPDQQLPNTNLVNELEKPTSRQIPPIQRSPSHLRPQLPPKPPLNNSSAVTASLSIASKKNEDSPKQKTGRSILRVPSLGGSRSRTPSRGPSEERVPKKKEYLHESVMYTKVKPTPPEPPLSGNRHHLLRGRQAAVSSNVTRVDVSPPKFISTTANPAATTIQIVGPRAPSPSPQKTTIIPSSVQSPTKMQVQVDPIIPPPAPVHDIPVQIVSEEQNIAPVYTKLSEARTTVTTTRSQVSSAGSTSSFIQPQIRPVPPRKPVRHTEITESLIEAGLPQKVKRPVSQASAGNLQPSRYEHEIQKTYVERNSHTNPASHNGVVIRVNQEETNIPIHVEQPNLRPSVSGTRIIETTQHRSRDVHSPSSAAHMNFDVEPDVHLSSHMEEGESSGDENDDFVKRSLVKASNRHLPGNGTESHKFASTVSETKTNIRVESDARKGSGRPEPDYDRLPARPGGPKVMRKPSFISSADDSDSSRGPVSYIASTRPPRKVTQDEAISSDGHTVPREDSAGRQKYEQRRLALRNFEDGLQRKRLNSSKASSSIDSDTNDRDDNFIQRKGNTSSDPYPRTGTIHHGQKSVTSTRSHFADRESDDGASDSIGIPEPLPEYDFPNRIQGRTIREVQEIRETVRLRNNSTSSTSSEDLSPSHKTKKREHHHYSRHFEISPEEINTARSLIHHRLPPNYNEPPQPITGEGTSRLNDRNRTPPPTRPLQSQRQQSNSPDGRRLPPHLPPQSPMHVGPVVHHSDGETRYYPEKPKKKMGIVRRLSELVRGERKPKAKESGKGMARDASSSSIEMDHPEPVPPAGTLSVRRQSPVRRYQDQPLRPPPANVPANAAQASRGERRETFSRPLSKNIPNRNSGNFSDATAASFAYVDQTGPPVYALPNKLQKQQNLRHRSLSEYDLNHPPPESRSTFQYTENQVKPSKSIESLTESVYKQKYRGPMIVTDRPYEEFNERVTKTHLIPYGKQDSRQMPVRNTARVRSGLYDKNAQHYSSTPLLTSSGDPIGYRMAAPTKPPRRYDIDSNNRGTDSDRMSHDSTKMEERIRIPAERPLERVQPEHDLRHLSARNDLYNDTTDSHRYDTALSVISVDDPLHRSRSPPRERFQSHIMEGKRTVEALVPEMRPQQNVQRVPTLRPVDVNVGPGYARTRIAANDYSNRRYHSAAAEINTATAEPPRKLFGRPARQMEQEADAERQYKSSYKLQMEKPNQPSGSVVAERSKLFNNPASRREYAVRR